MSIATTVALLATVTALAQQSTNTARGVAGTGPAPPSIAAAEVKPEDLCGIEGKVVNAATGAPVKKANLIMRRAEVSPGSYPTSYTTVTDDAGKFGMRDLEPGRYRLHLSRNGFVSMEYGAKRPTRPGTTLTLASGQRMTSVDFKMTPHSIITGRVVDTDGEPLAHVQISALSWRYTQRGKQLIPGGGGTSTNDLGEFRMFGLAPGRYYLRANYSGVSYIMDGSLDRSVRDAPDEGYVPTYYPGTADPTSAATLDITAGQLLNGVDIRLSKARTVRIRGRVNNQTGPSRVPIRVMLRPRDPTFFNGPSFGMASGPDLRFEFRGLAPGSYILTAVLSDGQAVLSGQQTIELGNTNIDNALVSIVPGATMTGEVKVEGAAGTVNLADMRVSLRPREQGSPLYGPLPNDRVQPDGTFTLKNVSADTMLVSVTGLPEGFYLKSATLGDEDAIENGINVNGGAAGALRLVVSPGAAQLEGSVTNEKQEPFPGATVVALPESEKRRDLFQYVKTATTDQHGRFSFKNLDPGAYRLYCWEDVDYAAWMDPEFLKPADSKARKVTLREGGRETVELQVIPIAQ